MLTDDRHEKIFAKLESMAAEHEPVARSRHVAAVVRRGEIVEFGNNSKKSHPFQRKFGRHDDAIYLHAETDALQRTIRNYGSEFLSGCSIYVCRMKYADSDRSKMIRGLSKPCIGCMRALATFDVKNVYFTCDEVGYEQL